MIMVVYNVQIISIKYLFNCPTLQLRYIYHFNSSSVSTLNKYQLL